MNEELKKFLEQFGKVEICEINDGEVKIKITDGWNNNIEGMKNAIVILDKIEALTDEEFPYIREVTMEHNSYQAIYYNDAGVDRHS